ncbi:MAG: hypothetical protein L6Q29_02095 [Candidatus Pacebacteria bacterium]|nr:hypothetical protein [Candidatus Paceibacterota bacterium]NUQ56974.1 hypothetical protein [Candidatus Paceibacter sp.]
MANDILKNNSLQSLIKSLNIDKNQEVLLLEKVPQMDLKERIDLFKDLTEIYLLNLEEKESLENLRRFIKN